MRIFLDENMPRKLLAALIGEGHEVESVHSLKLAGVSNGKLLDLTGDDFDLFFTNDARFAEQVRGKSRRTRAKLLRCCIPQQTQERYVAAFIAEFRRSDWSSFRSGDDWPAA